MEQICCCVRVSVNVFRTGYGRLDSESTKRIATSDQPPKHPCGCFLILSTVVLADAGRFSCMFFFFRNVDGRRLRVSVSFIFFFFGHASFCQFSSHRCVSICLVRAQAQRNAGFHVEPVVCILFFNLPSAFHLRNPHTLTSLRVASFCTIPC